MQRIWLSLLACLLSFPLWGLDSNRTLVISARQFPNLIGLPLEELRVVGFRNGSWAEIHFQWDERVLDAKRGRYVYAVDQALGKQPLDAALSGNRILDPDDELVCQSFDFGELGKNLPFQPVYEVALRDKVPRYAYVGRRVGQIPMTPSSRRYVSYDPAQQTVTTERYRMGFMPEAPFVPVSLVLKNGREERDILDRLKMRFYLDLRLFFNLKIFEGEISSRAVGYRLGPVRLIERMLLYYKLGPIRITPEAESDFLMTRDSLRIESEIQMPFDTKAHLKGESIGFGAFDLNREVYGSQVYAEHKPRPVTIDGVMTADETDLPKDAVHWWVMSGKLGTMIGQVMLDEALREAGVTVNLHYDDDAANLAPPEEEAGEALLGFSIHPTDLPRGRFRLTINHYFPDRGFAKGDERFYLHADQSLRVQALRVEVTER